MTAEEAVQGTLELLRTRPEAIPPEMLQDLMTLTGSAYDPSLMPCPACAVLDCQGCEEWVFTANGARHPCPCKAAGHDDDEWPDDEYEDFTGAPV